MKKYITLFILILILNNFGAANEEKLPTIKQASIDNGYFTMSILQKLHFGSQN